MKVKFIRPLGINNLDEVIPKCPKLCGLSEMYEWKTQNIKQLIQGKVGNEKGLRILLISGYF